MKKMKKSSKGFTLTELAIVIAVIAILIAVLVPTFISLINKANESNDVVTVRNMNTVLSTETDDIDKPTDALQIVYEEGGYSVANMTPKSTGKIVYDELTSSFIFVYSDGSTYPEDATANLTAYTTWELVSTSDISVSSDGAYHFEDSSYANNSIILKGSEWAGKTVYANYGVELWNDNDTSTTLNGLYIENTDSSVQTADAAAVSLAKSAIKTAGSADSTRNIIVNVRTNYLSYAADVYNISDHSTVNTLLSTAGKGTYYQYGTTSAYDITNSSNANVVVCNEKQADKINNKEVVVIKTDGIDTSIVIIDDTDTIIVDMSSEDDVKTIVVETTETLQITLTEEAVTITITNTATEEIAQEIVVTTTTSTTSDTTSYTSLVEFQEEATETGTGTEKYPYTISSVDELKAMSSGYCYELTQDITDISSIITIAYGSTISLDLNEYDLKFTGSKYIKVQGNLTLKSSVNGAQICSGSSYAIYGYGSNGKQATLSLKNVEIVGNTSSSNPPLYVFSYTTTVIDGCTVTDKYTGTSDYYSVKIGSNSSATIKSITCTGRVGVSSATATLNLSKSLVNSLNIAATLTGYEPVGDDGTDYISYSIKITANSAIAYIDTNGEKAYYANLINAFAAAVDGDTIVMQHDYSLSSSNNTQLAKYLKTGYNITVDLGGNTYTFVTYTLTIKNETSITFKNGNIAWTGTSTGSAAFAVETNSTLILDNVSMTCTGYALYPKGDAALVKVINSTISGSCAIGTNAATVDNYNVSIIVENSTLHGTACGILQNVPSTMSITGSTITGGIQAVIVRAGTATISNSTLKSELTDNSNWSKYDTINWGSGNALAYAILVIGNKNSTYAGDAQVTINNVTFAYDTSAGNSNGVYIYMYGGVVYNTTGSTDPNKAILYYDSDFDTSLITKGSDDYIVTEQSAE